MIFKIYSSIFEQRYTIRRMHVFIQVKLKIKIPSGNFWSGNAFFIQQGYTNLKKK